MDRYTTVTKYVEKGLAVLAVLAWLAQDLWGFTWSASSGLLLGGLVMQAFPQLSGVVSKLAPKKAPDVPVE